MRFSAVFALALPIVAIASAVPRTDSESCDTGSLLCCNSTQSASDPATSTLLGLLGIVLGPITGLVGLTCNPITVIGGGGNACTAQPVCCTDNDFNGLVALGCSPINIGL